MKKKIVVASVAFFLAAFSVALAEQGTTRNFGQKRAEWKLQRQQKIDELKIKKEEFKNLRQQFTAERCAKIQERIGTKTTNFDNGKVKHMSVYTNMKNRISKFIARFKKAGYDVAKIEADLKTLEDKITKFSDDYAAYVAKLKETKSFACGHSEGDFKGILLESKTLLKTVHQDAADIRTFVHNTIKADIMALRGQKKNHDQDNEDDNLSTGTTENQSTGTTNNQ